MSMAAFPLSNCTLVSTSSRTLDSKSFTQPLRLPYYPHHRSRFCNPLRSFTPIHPSSTGRGSFISFLSVQGAVTNTNEEEDEKTLKKAGDQLHESSLQTIIDVYKGAFLEGDQNTTSVVEARLQALEKEKNGLSQKVSGLSEEITSGKEKYIRLQANFDNFRKRIEKEKHTIKNNAQKEVIARLLPMIDNFEKARQQIKPQTEKEKKIDVSYQGIYKQFVETLRSWHVSAVPTVGRPFDPSLHEAIAREESKEVKEGIIIQEFRRGFLLGEQVIRPARVKVSKGPGDGKKSSIANGDADKPIEQPATAAAGLGIDEH